MLALSNKAAIIAKESVAKTQNDSKKREGSGRGGRLWLEEMVTKQEILDRVGIVDPVIQPNIDSTLSNISYKNKSKAEVTDDIVNDLERQIEKLKYQRIKMAQVKKGAQPQSTTTEVDVSKMYPDETELQRALKEKDITKLGDLVDRGRSKLDELHRKWQEKKEMEQMKESGLLNSSTQQISSLIQEPRFGGRSSVSNERKSSVSPNSKIVGKSKVNNESKMARIFPQEGIREEDDELKTLLAKSEKLTMLDPKRVDFQNKLSNYLTHKKLQTDTSVYFEDKVKKKFERFQSPESHSKSQERKNNRNIVDSPISHLPIKEQENMKEQFEKENRQNNFQTMNKVNKRKLHEINELFIIKLVFDALNHENKGFVSKDEALDYIMGSQEIITIFDLKTPFSGEVHNFKSEKEGYLTFQELSKVMMKRLPAKTQNNIKSAFPQNKPKTAVHNDLDPQDALLIEGEIQVFREIFEGLDQYEDLLIKTNVYLKALKNDIKVKQLLDKPAVRIPLVNRELTVNDILSQIEADIASAVEDGLNTMQYISWNQFRDYFKTYKASKFTRAQPKEKEELEMLLSEEQILIIQDVFDSVPRVTEDFVDKIEFIKAVKRDPQIQSFWKNIVNEKNEQTVGGLFDEILESDFNYLKWEEILPFFVQKEKNVFQDDVEGTEDFQGQTYKSEFATFAPDHISEAAKEDDSRIDSQEDEQSPTSKMKNQRKGKVTINEKTETNKLHLKGKTKDPKEFEELDAMLKKEYEQLQIDLRSYGVVKKNVKDEKGLTIPKPFKFYERENQAKVGIRQQKVEKMVEEKRKEEEDALKFQFRANPLPASVKIPMYGSLLKAQEEKRMEVTEKSKQITLANQKPFSFYERELNKEKNVPKEEVFQQFKANPIPQSSKMEIFKEKEEQEKKAREDRIKARMEENAKSVKMPPRMEAYEKAKSEGTLNMSKNPKKYKPDEPTFKPNINRDIPDFEALKQEFDGKLQQKKREMPKTQFKPFQFQKAASESVRETSQAEEKPVKQKKRQMKKSQNKVQNAERGREANKKKAQPQEEEEENREDDMNGNDNEYAEDPDHNENEENNEENEYNEYNEDFEQEDQENRHKRRNEEEEEKGGDDNMFQFEEKEEMAGDQAINPMAQRDVENNERPKSEKENNNTQELQQTRGSRADKPKAFLTKKLEKEFERKKKDKEAREKRLEDIKKEDEMRKKKEKDFAPKVQNAFKTVNKLDKKEEQNKERIKEARNRMKQEQEDYNERIREMKTKVETAPLMIEKKLYGSKLLNKYREAISKGWQTLEGPLEKDSSDNQRDQNTQSENYQRTKSNYQEKEYDGGNEEHEENYPKDQNNDNEQQNEGNEKTENYEEQEEEENEKVDEEVEDEEIAQNEDNEERNEDGENDPSNY